MLLYFKCRRCRKPQSADVRQSGNPFICPICHGEMIVPSASDPDAVREMLAHAPAPPAPIVASPPPPAPPGPTPPGPQIVPLPNPPLVRRQRSVRRWAVAVALLVVLGAGGFVASKAWLRRPVPDAGETVVEAILLGPTAASEIPPAKSDVQPVDISQSHELRGKLLVLAGIRLTQEMEEEPPTLEKPREQPAAVPVLQPAGAAEAPLIKRIQPLTEDQLRQGLARAPEIGITLGSVPALLEAYRNHARVSGGTSPEPLQLLQVRPDLKGLPLRAGSACRIDLPAAVTLQQLSQKLRVYLQAAVPRDPNGNRPSPVVLHERMRVEMRGRRPEWLRPEAIPTLLQLLMHEDPPLRLMLVELLAEIDGPASTAALAQRAVFDLASEVREAAIEALARRPLGDARPVFFYGLRYPWAPAAAHAAEALVALRDREAVPQLVTLLKQPDPAGAMPAGGYHVVREVVRVNHLNNCLLCHPPAVTGNEPVLGLDPVVRVPASTGVQSAVQRLQGTPGSHSYGGGGRRSGGSRRTAAGGSPVLVPLLIRGDVTYLRQDFSVQLPILQPVGPPSPGVRFDYLVRVRTATPEEVSSLKARHDPNASYPQRDAVLFALRELTGQDAGPTTEAWQRLFPTADLEVQAARLSEELIRAPAQRREQLLMRLRDGKGVAYTQALAAAIPRLDGPFQERARAVLVERLTRMTTATLRDKLQDEDVEVRRAAVLAGVQKDERKLLPDLMVLVEDPEPRVAQTAQDGLRRLTGQDYATADAWKDWWKRQGEP